MKYSSDGVPFAAELAGAVGNSSESAAEDRVIKLQIEAELKDPKGDVVELVQRGFSEIAVTSGGNVYEY